MSDESLGYKNKITFEWFLRADNKTDEWNQDED